MKIASTLRPTFLKTKAAPKPKSEPQLDFVQRLAADPFPNSKRWAMAIPTVGGLALGASAGLIGEGLGGGASIPGIAVFGLAGAAIGSKIDGEDSKKWTLALGGVGSVVGAAGVVAGAVGGWPGAVAGAISLGGAGFALGHLFSQA